MPNAHRLNENAPVDDSPKQVFLSDHQFAKLVELLTPGYELAKFHLLDQQTKPPAEPPAPLDE